MECTGKKTAEAMLIRNENANNLIERAIALCAIIFMVSIKSVDSVV